LNNSHNDFDTLLYPLKKDLPRKVTFSEVTHSRNEDKGSFKSYIILFLIYILFIFIQAIFWICKDRKEERKEEKKGTELESSNKDDI
jgi:hypothetical protein